MRRSALLLAAAVLVLPVTALVQAQTQAPAERPTTPRPAPTAVLPKATPVHSEPKGKAPAGLAVLQPLPVAPAPLSPVVVPGEPPPVTAPAVVAPMAAAETKAPPPASEARGPLPAVKPSPAPGSTPAAEERKPAEAKPARRIVYAKEGIYIRVAPGRNSRVLDTLEEGEAAELLPDKSPEAGWARIARNGRPVGWVSSAYLTERSGKRTDDGCSLPSDLPGKRSASIAEGAAARVLADANVRQAPDCDGRVLEVLEEGETVTVVGTSGGWYRVAHRGRTLGYVSAPLLGEAGGR